MFILSDFINENVIKRSESMFVSDIEKNKSELEKNINGKSFLVIGGAGSIGSSFIKQILKFKPKTLVVVDINENGLAELTRDIRSTTDITVPDDYITYPIDYASGVFTKMFRSRNGFDIVANFSAHKHVRSEKDIFSVEALLRNNVINARKLLELLAEYPPEAYFCVSTDKAANPVNIMGASKRLMEDMIFSYSDIFPVKTARFANVAFSNGSLPDGFMHRISKRQPISAPSDVKRFFVSPEESGQICMLSCMLGENRAIFFPKLEEEQMLRFDEIAVSLLGEMGYRIKKFDSDEAAKAEMDKCSESSTEYPVHFSASDTSGEKAYEEFYTEDEKVDLLRFGSLGVIEDKNIPDREKLTKMISKLEKLFDDGTATKQDVVDAISEYLPEFRHIETGKSLDSKM